MVYTQRQSYIVLLAAALLFCIAGSARGLVLHPGGEPNLATWTDRPSDNVVGRWGHTACCVAVSRNCVVTTRHQAGSLNTQVEIAGGRYSVSDIWEHETADLRLARLYGANLTDFVELFEGRFEAGRQVVIGGFGAASGALLENHGVVYGYDWDSSSPAKLRWGTNRIERTEDNKSLEELVSDVVIADFDGLGEGKSTVYECTVGGHDSGGGWFVKTAGDWRLAGLSRAIDVHFEQGHENDPNYSLWQAWFRDRGNPGAARPDYLDAVRISSYAGWIKQRIPAVRPGDLTGDDLVDMSDLVVFGHYWGSRECRYPDWCAGADSEPDGDIDWRDMVEFSNNWLEPEEGY
ncbi:MAG: hypothetical protein JSU94_13185 [Phycisphaerales bacterium]|nr:MAG: hypothetical protein JSU94_13185 [Phycisphaerales bacterium]